MGVKRARYCVRTYLGGWRIWDRLMSKWWGKPYDFFPDSVVMYLNEKKRNRKKDAPQT